MTTTPPTDASHPLIDAARSVREQAYAPYSGFRVGAALRAGSGAVYLGVNVENVAYPEGTCAEAGAIAAMCAAGEREIIEIAVVADSPDPIACCGGCRQKIAEFATPATQILMATLTGKQQVATMPDLLPGAFGRQHMDLP